MDEDRAGTVREWNSRSIEGHAGLRRLADEEFSGVIETDRGAIRAFMTNGRIVGIDRGGIDDLDGMAMTAYEAPDDAVPVLFAMQERGGEPRAKYYTEDTPLSEVNRTLEEAGFTGYVELSENVLSGDYYVVYHGGRSSSVAFVGNSSELMTGREAFERADDEVGIYEVIDVDVPVIDVPGGADRDATADRAGANANTDAVAEAEAEAGPGGPTPAADGADADAAGPAPDRAGTDAGPGTGAGAGSTAGDPDPPAGESADERGEAAGSSDRGRRSADAGDGRSRGAGPYGSGEEIRVGAGLGTDEDGNGNGSAGAGESGGADAGPPSGAGGAADARSGAEAEDGARTGPAERSERPESPGTDATDRPADHDAGEPGERAADAGAGSDAGRPDADGSGGAAPDREGGAAGSDAAGSTRGRPAEGAGTDAGRSDGAASGPTRDRLAAELAEAREALERVREERDGYRDDAERLRERVATLEARIEALESAAGGDEGDDEGDEGDDEGDAGNAIERSLSPEEAMGGTNLFVRYRSKAEPTLEAAHGGDADPEAVNRNIRIEQHTEFEAAGVGVDGEPFDSFLTSTFEYQFVEWVIRDLLYELRSTGSRAGMEQLYDAIPAIDRIEFDGEVRIDADPAGAGGEEGTDARRFDVIFRDRMGGPLIVANLHESRDPTPAGDVTSLIEDARTVAVAAETIGAAFVVTTSYYEPQALDAASSATGGGFLSRSRKESYVKMKRKRGFHLCLLEARDGEFNLRIPEL
ncbi:MAG: hypothetical protein ABEH47_03285 [Haloferacaceae archaeon]